GAGRAATPHPPERGGRRARRGRGERGERRAGGGARGAAAPLRARRAGELARRAGAGGPLAREARVRLTSVSRNSFGEGRRALVARAAALLRPSLGLRAAAAPRSLADDEAFLRRLERLALALQRPPTAGLAGDHRSRRKNDAPEFADYRTYSPGDDFRRIDWKAYGRLGALYYRLGEAQEDLALHLLVDTSASMDYGTPNKLDYARQLAAALGYLALARLDAVGVGALEPRTPPLPLLRGKLQAGRLFAYLDGLGARAGARQPAPLLESVRAYRRGAARGVVVLLTDGFFPDEHAAGLGELLQAGYLPVLLHLLSPQELEPDMAGDLELVDA